MTRERAPQGVTGHERFQRVEWRVQRWGLLLLALAVIAWTGSGAGDAFTALRVAAVYGFLLIAFRLAGKRTLAQMTAFDLVLVMIIGDATQQALVGQDNRMTTAFVVIATLILLDVVMGWLKSRSPALDRVVDGLPIVVVEHGVPLIERLNREGIDLNEILAAARERHGLARLEDIDYAVLESSGGLSIIPKRP